MSGRLRCAFSFFATIAIASILPTRKPIAAKTNSQGEEASLSTDDTGLPGPRANDGVTDAKETVGSSEGSNEKADLDEEFLELQELLNTVIITATKTEQTLAEASSVVSVVTRDELIRRNARSVADALAGIPGLYVNTDHVFRDIGVRGISGEMRGASRLIKVMINGQSVAFRSDTANFVGPEMIPIDVIERIEVIRGPGSALYGANAFLGVVNVITRKGADLDGALFRLGASSFRGNTGYDFGLAAGVGLEGVDILVGVGNSRTDRSGLKIPCTTYGGDCVQQRENANEPSVFDRSAFDDIENPTSAFLAAKFDIGAAFNQEIGALGYLDLLVNHQEIDSTASYADWAMMERDQYTDLDGNARKNIRGSGNRVGLHNTILRAEYGCSWLDDALQLRLAGAYAQGGISNHEYLRDYRSGSGRKERSRYGYKAKDFSLEAHSELLKGGLKFDSGALAGTTVINSVDLLLALDYSVDTVRYAENRFEVPIRYRRSDLANAGVLSQLTVRLWNDRLGFTLGARYDRYRGANLTETQLAKLDTGMFPGRDATDLCNGRTCFEKLNYRLGVTHSVLKGLGTLGDDETAVLDDLFVKALLGTAFKAPAPLFLFHDDSLGGRPLNPNPALRPQRVRSLELVLGAQMFGKQLNWSLVAFDNYLEEKVAFQIATLSIVALNAEDVQSRGIEANVDLRWRWLSVQANMAWQSSERVFEEDYSTKIKETFAFPDFKAAFTVAADIAWLGSLIEAEAHYIGERVGHPMNLHGADSEEDKYELDPYLLIHVNLVSRDWEFLTDKPTSIAVSVKNVLNTKYEYSGFQPYYGTDIPGEPRILLFSIRQHL